MMKSDYELTAILRRRELLAVDKRLTPEQSLQISRSPEWKKAEQDFFNSLTPAEMTRFKQLYAQQMTALQAEINDLMGFPMKVHVPQSE